MTSQRNRRGEEVMSTDEHPVASRMREEFEAWYGDMSNIMRAINGYFYVVEKFRCPYNDESTERVTNADLEQAEKDMLDSIRTDALALPPENGPAAPQEWRCFHCGEAFTDARFAALHFGGSERQNPVCSIDAAEYRAMEQRMIRYNEEDSDLHRDIYGLQARHATELRREEERGYARGLTDAISQRTPDWKIEPHGDGWVIAEPDGRTHVAYDKPTSGETERVLARLCNALAAGNGAARWTPGELDCVAWASRHNIEAVLNTPSAQRSAIDDARGLHLLDIPAASVGHQVTRS